MEVEGKRIILGYSEKRRARDEEIRKALLEKLEKRIGEKSSSQLVKPSYRRYVKFKEWEVEIDQKKVEEASLWDGYFGYYTSNQELTPEEVIGAYKLLCEYSSCRNHPVRRVGSNSSGQCFHWFRHGTIG